ncbi:MAG: glycosyltransferase [Candidatus Promineifilaceae bacterium]|nr:glycosyltransferase [Candidatus Promineifilaceae bacterium]
MADFLAALYLLDLFLLSLYGLLGLLTLWLYWRHKDEELTNPPTSIANLPRVTIQLPIYNERFVIQRLINAVAKMDYPRDRLQIQVVDDSTDDTSAIVTNLVTRYRSEGINIQHIRRSNRQGYKAGALANAMLEAEGEFLAIFDADFEPHADFLINTVPHFLSQPKLGMIQVRWGHLNDKDSPLTAAQSIALDKHFVMEQSVRHRANLFPKFNGAGGIWRRTCIEDSGGWQADTVCEDLCLSTRAILRGWHFRFLPKIIAPAELPTGITAYKNQQARWAKGSIQCLQKYSSSIIKEKNYSLLARLYALLSMSAYATHFLLLALLILQVPLLLLDVQLPSWTLLFTIIGLSQPILFVLAQKQSYDDWLQRLAHFPTLILVAVGTAPSNGKAMIQALLGKNHPFVRTPKGMKPGKVTDDGQYRLPLDYVFIGEVFFLLYAIAGLIIAIYKKNPAPMLLLLMSLFGFGYVLFLEIRELLPILLLRRLVKN